MKLVLTFALAMLGIPCAAQSSGKAEIFGSAEVRSRLAQLSQPAKVSGSGGSTLGDYGTHAIKLSERTASGGAEVHAHFDDVMLVMDGTAELITGGEVIGPRNGANGETTGSGISNGASRHIFPGDLIHIPAGVPHQLIIAPGTSYSALVIKVKE